MVFCTRIVCALELEAIKTARQNTNVFNRSQRVYPVPYVPDITTKHLTESTIGRVGKNLNCLSLVHGTC